MKFTRLDLSQFVSSDIITLFRVTLNLSIISSDVFKENEFLTIFKVSLSLNGIVALNSNKI